MTCAMITLIGVALLVFAIVSPGFLERDLEQREDA